MAILFVIVALLLTQSGSRQAQHRPSDIRRLRPAVLPNTPLLIGYWHNFVNGAGFIRLADASSQFDVVDIAFGIPVSGSTSTIGFTVD